MSKIFAKVNGLHEIFDTSVNDLGQTIYDTSKIKDDVLASHNINENTIFYIETDSVDHQLDYRGTYIYSHNELFSNYDNKGGQYIQTNIVVNHNDMELGYAFGKITVSDTNKLWNISYHIQAYSSNNTDYNSEYDVYLYGYNNNILGYCAFNAVESLKPYLNHIIIKENNAIKIGLSFIADNNDRKISIIINDYRNCSFEKKSETNIDIKASNVILFDAATKGLVTSELSVTNTAVSGTANVSTANITNLQATTSTLSNVTISSATVSTMTVSTINGVTVGDDPKFTDTDTTYTVTVSGTGNALSTIGLSGTTITATLSSFATSDHNHNSVYSPISHTHGNISNDGTITTSNSIANGDAIVISRTTSGTISKSTIIFDGTSSNLFLSKNGNWGLPVDEKVKVSTTTSNSNFPLMAIATSSVTSGNTYQAIYDTGIVINPNKHSVAEGSNTTASGDYSHAGGFYTIADVQQVTAIGRYNSTCSNGDLLVVGNGTGNTARKTVFKVSDSTSTTSGGGNAIVTVTGRVNATDGFFQTSDKCQKNIISDLSLEKVYDLIDKCQTIIYTLKDDPENKEQIGMVAQEIQEFFPELISEDKNGMLSLDYSRLTVIIFKVLKDLIKRINKIEQKLN